MDISNEAAVAAAAVVVVAEVHRNEGELEAADIPTAVVVAAVVQVALRELLIDTDRIAAAVVAVVDNTDKSDDSPVRTFVDARMIASTVAVVVAAAGKNSTLEFDFDCFRIMKPKSTVLGLPAAVVEEDRGLSWRFALETAVQTAAAVSKRDEKVISPEYTAMQSKGSKGTEQYLPKVCLKSFEEIL